MKPGIHTMTGDAYHADPAQAPSLSASIAQLLLTKSPKHAWIVHPKLGGQKLDPHEERFDVGTAAHSVLLEGRNILHEVEASDWRTKDAQEVRKKARENGLIALLSVQYRQVLEMAASVRAQLENFDAEPALFQDGKPEQSLIWEDHGVWCRARLDWLHDDFSAIDDLKSTARSANPHEWTRTTMWNIGADLQVAFYLRGLKALTGKTAAFRYVVVETTPPYALSVVSLAPDALELANAKIDTAITIWRDCLERNEWPSYPRQVCFAELPPWSEARWMERQALEEMGDEVAAA